MDLPDEICPANRISLNPYDVARMSWEMGISTGEFVRRYVEPGTLFVARAADGSCPLPCRGDADTPSPPLACRLSSRLTDAETARSLRWARRYREALRAWRARSLEEGAEYDVLAIPPELPPTRYLDVDAVVEERRMERGMPPVSDLESKLELHLEALLEALH